MAIRDGWFRSLPAPGVRNSAFGFTSRSQEDAPRLSEVGDAIGGTIALAAVIGMGGAQQPAEPPLHLSTRRVTSGVEPEDVEGPSARVGDRTDDPMRATANAGEIADQLGTDVAIP